MTANAIFWSADAVSPGNPSGAASLSWDPDDVYCRPYYNYADELVDRFLVYRLYWDDSSLRFTVVDDGAEHDLYVEPFAIDEVSAEFTEPFYLIANLAIGGAFTDAYNLGDPGSGLPVSMPFPAEMLIDYIRVYEWNGQGGVHLGPPAPASGTFGLFTDETPTDGGLVPGVTRRSTCGRGPSSTGRSHPTRATTCWPGRRRAWAGSAPASWPHSR
ncbi:MAG: hypothetical protein R3D98_02200 [Candidatus Krumholzibacteriia bacterium]